MTFRHLEHSRILALGSQMLEYSGTGRDQLLLGVPVRFVRKLSRSGLTDEQQVREDLAAMNGTREFEGVVPLVRWLENAIADAQEPLRGVLRQAHLEVVNGMSGAQEPQPMEAFTFETQEAIVHRDDRLPFHFLRGALEAGRAVARVRVPRFDGGRQVRDGSTPRWYDGTGWLIGGDVLITNHHVIQARDRGDPPAEPDVLAAQAAGALVHFDYESLHVQGREVPVVSLLAWDATLDFALLQLGEAPGCEPLTLGREPLRLAANSPLPLNIIQHPLGGAKQIALRNNLATRVDASSLRYFTDTDAGASGSPVCDDNWRVVALHRASLIVAAVDFQGKKTAVVNVGTPIVAILGKLAADQRVRDLPALQHLFRNA